MSLSNAQRKLGYYPIVYNIKNNKFWIPRPGKGDSYVEIDIEVGEGGGSGDPPPGGGGGSDVNLDGYATEDWVEAQGYLTETDIDGLASEQWVLDQEYITIAEIPPPVLEGALVFKGTVSTEANLPTQNKTGDLWFVEDEQHLYAWGEDGKWHKLSSVEDVNLDGYARLDGAEFTGAVGAAGGLEVEHPRSPGAPLKVYGNSQSGNEGIVIGHKTSGGDTTDYLHITKVGELKTISYDPSNQDAHGFVIGCYPIEDDKPQISFQEPHSSPETNPIFNIYHGATQTLNIDASGSVTAKEFIGDGSKLTNLPGGGGADVNLDEYARLDGAEFTAGIKAPDFEALRTGPGYRDGERVDDIHYHSLYGAAEFEVGGYEAYNKLFFNSAAALSNYGPTMHLMAGKPLEESSGFTSGAFVISEHDGTLASIHPYDVLFGVYFDGQGTGIDLQGPGLIYTRGNIDAPHGQIRAKEFKAIDSVIAGDNIRVNPNSTGVEINGELGVVHVKPKSDSATAFEVFKPDGSTAQEASSMFRVAPNGDVQVGHTAIELKPDGTVTAAKFIGDGSELTNLPGDVFESTTITAQAFVGSFVGDGSGLTNVTPALEGTLIFRGSIDNEEALPDGASQGDLYFNETNNHLYAKGGDTWHKLNTIEDVHLEEYARNDQCVVSESIQAPHIGTGPDIYPWPYDNMYQSVHITKENGVQIYAQGGQGVGADPDRPTEGTPMLAFTNFKQGGHQTWFFDYQGSVNCSYLQVGRPTSPHGGTEYLKYFRGSTPGIRLFGDYNEIPQAQPRDIVLDITASDDQADPPFQIFKAGNPNPQVSITQKGVITAESVVLKSPNGTQYKITVADDGTLSTTAV